ncbi:MAG: hypothetical protein CME62_11890 [Halobacteriovoraceae bacterium]|nr:hypothetical protein [Halobacteriovoraceae bacterium]|tara:strand:- start:11426 stop:12283 length:858 start_codon:yes stop_codon:yes gene_type:complete
MDKDAFLKKVEIYLIDLSLVDRNRILSELIAEDITGDNPMQVAEQKRREHGFPPFPHQNNTGCFKLMLKTFVVMFALFLIFIGFLVWKFTPLFQIDEEKQKIVILGGLIDIDGEAGKFKIGETYHFEKSKYQNEFQSRMPLTSEIDEVILNLNSGKIDIHPSSNEELSLKCQMETAPGPKLIKKDQSITFDFSKLNGSCRIEVPAAGKLSLNAQAATINLIEVENDISVYLENGNVGIKENTELLYQYSFDIGQGFSDEFETSAAQGAIEIQIEIENGGITKIRE